MNINWTRLAKYFISRDPCKRCIVSVMCTLSCSTKKTYKLYQAEFLNLTSWIVVISLALAVFVLIGGMAANIVQFIYQ